MSHQYLSQMTALWLLRLCAGFPTMLESQGQSHGPKQRLLPLQSSITQTTAQSQIACETGLSAGPSTSPPPWWRRWSCMPARTTATLC